MKDLIRAILGQSKCDWCQDRGPSIVDRLCRLDQLMPINNRRWYEKVVLEIDTFWTETLPIWKLGQKWHYRYHVED